MTKNPLVSIIIPAYNIQDYILKCLKSVAEQNYDDLEIIVVDDGSMDKTGVICDDFASSDSRVKVFHKKNGGLSDARNYGIKKARGEIVTLVDGDDFVERDYIATMYDAMQKEDADIVVCGYDECLAEDATMSGREAAVRLLVRQENLDIVAWNKLYRKRLFVENDIWYPVGEKHEDALTTYKLLASAKKVAYVGKSLYNYVEREGSIMDAAKKEERLKMRERAALEAVKYFRDDKDLQQAAEIAVLTAKYAYIDNAINGEISRSYLAKNMNWVREHMREYDNNKYMTKKLKLYNKLCKNSATGFFYKIFRKIKHE